MLGGARFYSETAVQRIPGDGFFADCNFLFSLTFCIFLGWEAGSRAFLDQLLWPPAPPLPRAQRRQKCQKPGSQGVIKNENK